MSFSWRMGLFVVVALLLALLSQFVLGFWLFQQALNDDLETDLTRYSLLVEQGIVQNEQGVSFAADTLAVVADFTAYASARARVINSLEQPVLLIGGRYPNDLSGWLVNKKRLPNGLMLETIMNTSAHNTALKDYLKVSLLSLPALILIFSGLGLFLSIRLLRPLRNLQSTVATVTDASDLRARVKVGRANDELSKLARSYNQMMAKLEQFFERERTFTRYASHELRNPLTALRVQVDAALAGSVPTEKVLPILKRELARLSSIQDSLLILAKDELNPEQSVDLTTVVDECVDRARLLAADKPLLIDYEVPGHAVIKGDRTLLSRLLDNLLENALHHTDAGEIKVSVEAVAGGLRLSVQDQGVGVEAKHLARLTTPFYRTTTKSGGVGLGLAVVQHIASAHGASLSFDNVIPVGFKASVAFPESKSVRL